MPKWNWSWAKAAMILLLVAAVLLAIAAEVRYDLAPRLVRARLETACLNCWDGSLEIERIQVAPSGQIGLRGVRLLDRQGRTHAAADAARLHVRDLLGRQMLTHAVVDGLDLYVHRDEGEYCLPFHGSRERLSESVDLDAFELHGRSLWLVDKSPGEGDSSARRTVSGGARDFSVTATRRDGVYVADVSLPPPPQPEGESSTVEGLLSATLVFHGRGPSLKQLRGPGMLTMQRINARQSQWTAALFSFLNSDVATVRSDLQAVFTLEGTVITVRDAVLADAISVMRVEEGGTIDLDGGGLDLYLVTLRLRGVSGLLESIPVVSLATTISNKLTRVHITGTWDEQEIRKEPIEDVAAATVTILGETARLGGQIGPGATGALRGLFTAMGGASRPRSATQPARP